MSAPEAFRVYRQTLRAAGQFTDYNFRHYFARRAREDFRAFFSQERQADDASREAFMQKAKSNLEMLKRQSVISQMYKVTGPGTNR
mmetsp:Transcript_104344/g.248305  ORF Transcript_104344/g.248305 Transcript_104344/m.248305 type:complete len:86 (-) Transcript_104344:98-355(-)